jgi:hypothetical protein
MTKYDNKMMGTDTPSNTSYFVFAAQVIDGREVPAASISAVSLEEAETKNAERVKLFLSAQ